MTARILVSRNKREGGYCGRSYVYVARCNRVLLLHRRAGGWSDDFSARVTLRDQAREAKW